MTYQGPPPAKKRRVWPIVLVVLMIICCGGCAIVGLLKVTEATSTPTKTYQVGDRAADGDLAFTVVGMNCGSKTVGDKFVARTALGTFCVVTLNVENVGSKATMFLDSWQKAYDEAGREYSVDSAATLTAAPTTWLAQINPGASVTAGVVVFDVPTGVRLVSVVLHDGAFSGGVRIHVS
jgi:hypothetical protein